MWELNDKGRIKPTELGGILLTVWALIGVVGPMVYMIVRGVIWCASHLTLSQVMWWCVGVVWVVFAILMLASIPWIRRSRLARVNDVLDKSLGRS